MSRQTQKQAKNYLHSSVHPVIQPLLVEAVRQQPKDFVGWLQEQLAEIKIRESFPTAQSEMTAEWLTYQLGSKVESFEINKIGMGFTADAHKVR